MRRAYDHRLLVDAKYRLCLYILGKSTGGLSDYVNTLQDQMYAGVNKVLFPFMTA
jgi:hypothetical protein